MATTTLPSCHTRTDSKDRHHPLSPFVRLSVRLFVRPFVLSFVCLFVCSFINLLVVPSSVRLSVRTMTSHCENSPYSGRGQHAAITIGDTGGGGDDTLDEWELLPVCIQAPSRASRSSLEKYRFVRRSPWAQQAVGFTSFPSFVQPALLTMRFGDDGMALMVMW